MSRLTVRMRPTLHVLVLFAPVIFGAHFLEEAPGFVPWFNAHVARGITEGLFWRVNLTALAVTTALAMIQWISRTSTSAGALVTWLSFLMLANALFHIAGAVRDGAYMPGLLTAVLLYLPYYAWIVFAALRGKILSYPALVIAAAVGAAPMLLHGYLIVFRRDRLF